MNKNICKNIYTVQLASAVMLGGTYYASRASLVGQVTCCSGW